MANGGITGTMCLHVYLTILLSNIDSIILSYDRFSSDRTGFFLSLPTDAATRLYFWRN